MFHSRAQYYCTYPSMFFTVLHKWDSDLLFSVQYCIKVLRNYIKFSTEFSFTALCIPQFSETSTLWQPSVFHKYQYQYQYYFPPSSIIFSIKFRIIVLRIPLFTIPSAVWLPSVFRNFRFQVQCYCNQTSMTFSSNRSIISLRITNYSVIISVLLLSIFHNFQYISPFWNFKKLKYAVQ